MTIRIGGFCASIVRIWTGDVCVRRSSRSRPSPPPFTKNVSTASRAGWSGGKLSDSKLYQSVSTPGPSATS